MACWLRQSSAVDIAIGPFLDSVDGNSVEGALTITQPDIRLKKNGGSWGQKNAAQTLSHEEAGWYQVALNTTDTNTLGILIVAIHEADALPVWREFMVVPVQVYDSFLLADLLHVDTREVGGTAQTSGDIMASANYITARIPSALVSGRMDASVGAMAANVLTASAINADAITAAKIAAGAIDLATLAADTDVYTSRWWITDDDTGTSDRYGVVWYKNGQEIVAGITSPLIRVYKQADGTDLVAETAMTEIGSEQTFRYVEATNRTVNGVGYVVRFKATIGGSVRTASHPFGRPTA